MGNATLPLQALQFILLTVLLTFIFYKPIGKLLEERETFISNNLAEASAKLLKADELCEQYETQLKEAKTGAQDVIAKAESEKRNCRPRNYSSASRCSEFNRSNK